MQIFFFCSKRSDGNSVDEKKEIKCKLKIQNIWWAGLEEAMLPLTSRRRRYHAFLSMRSFTESLSSLLNF
jgi:hypothetical protein